MHDRPPEIPDIDVVSIPKRVWGALMLAATKESGLSPCVSIPKRVWGALMHPFVERRKSLDLFQSLRGFWEL